MKLHFDNKIVIKKSDDKVIVYSPFNHRLIKVNNFTLTLIEHIINENGSFNCDDLIIKFKNIFNVNIEKKDFETIISYLVSEKIFFNSEEDFITERNIILSKNYESPKQILVAYLHPTLKCNFNCSYCYNRQFSNNLKELSTEEWIDIINTLKEKGVKTFVFTGGEPLVRADLKTILKETREKGIHFNLLTNGSLLKDRFNDIDPLIDSIIMSLDSFDIETNAKNRSDVNFNNILDILELYSKHNPKKLTVRSVITKNNKDEVEEFNAILKNKYGLNSNNVIFLPNDKSQVDLIPNIECAGCKVLEDLDYDPTIKIVNRCDAGKHIIAINPEGDVFPCQSLLNDCFKMGNVKDVDWYDNIFNSTVAKEFQNLSVDKVETCKDCSYRYYCSAGCPAIPYKVYGNLNSHPDFLCDHLKKVSENKILGNKIQWAKTV